MKKPYKDRVGRVHAEPATEFIRRMLLHMLPPGFHRIRHYGFLANRNRQQKLTECRRLLRTPPPAAETGPVATDHRDRYEALTGRSLRRCPRCHDGNMQAVDHLAGRGVRSSWIRRDEPIDARQAPFAVPGDSGPVDLRLRPLSAAAERPSRSSSPTAVGRQPPCNAVWNTRQFRLPTMQRP